MSYSAPKPLLYIEAEPPASEDKRENRFRHRELVAMAAGRLDALEWQSADVDHWLVDLEQAAHRTPAGAPVAWASYHRPVYRLDFASERNWETLRAGLAQLLPGWRIELWRG